MSFGAVTSYIDLTQIVLYAFWFFFLGLIFYLRREDKREGYPLVFERPDAAPYLNFPPIPSPKIFRLADGSVRIAPRGQIDRREIMAAPVARWIGAPLQPTGNPMLDAVGPAAYADRADVPDRTVEGHDKIVPLRAAPEYLVELRDPDPRGMAVIGADGRVAGTVRDAWVDRSESIIRYFEVEVAGTGRSVLLPMPFARVSATRRMVKVKSILAEQFAHVPALKNPNQVTLREEDRISAYFGGGVLYAVPGRTESQL